MILTVHLVNNFHMRMIQIYLFDLLHLFFHIDIHPDAQQPGIEFPEILNSGQVSHTGYGAAVRQENVPQNGTAVFIHFLAGTGAVHLIIQRKALLEPIQLLV